MLSCLFAYLMSVWRNGLVNGPIADDARACLLDAGIAGRGGGRSAAGRMAWRDASAADLLADMRIVYSRLYLARVGIRRCSPVRKRFLHVNGDASWRSLFTPVTLDVERLMREAGVVAKNARKEPCDSVFEEFSSLSHLHAKLAGA